MNNPDAGRRPHPAPVASAMPRLLEGSRSTGVLLLHGWTGYPGQYYYLAEQLNKAGFTVSVPRLPGHGTSHSDFLRSRSRDWIIRAEDAFRELSRITDQVVPVGVSMGALLALHIGSHWQVPGIVAAAPAAVLRHRLAYLSPFFRYIIKSMPAKTEEKEIADPDEAYIRAEYWSVRYIAAIAELLKVRRKVLAEIKAVTAPLLIIEAEKDEMVTLKSGAKIIGKVSSHDIRTLVLDKSPHQVVNGCEREKVAAEILAWLLTLTKEAE